MTSYMIYTDDSGDERYTTFTALLFPIELWSSHLEKWLKYRHNLLKKTDVSPRFKLHAYEWLTGKGLPVSDDPESAINTTVGIRRQWSRKALLTMGKMDGLHVVSYRHTSPIRADAYGGLLAKLDECLQGLDAHGVLVVDGKPAAPEPMTRLAHRALPIGTRRIVEDGWTQASASSQPLQMADLAAYCFFQACSLDPDRSWMHDWYATYLHDLEITCDCP